MLHSAGSHYLQELLDRGRELWGLNNSGGGRWMAEMMAGAWMMGNVCERTWACNTAYLASTMMYLDISVDSMILKGVTVTKVGRG